MAKPTANLRLFVAAYPPLPVAQAMLALLPSMELPPHRNASAEQVHLTMQFIGDTPARDLEQTIESVKRAAAGIRALTLTPRMLLTLPERGPARLLALETDGPPGLMELHRRLATRLARNVRSRDAERFRPHFTLCRFRSPAGGLKLHAAIELAAFEIDRIVLMRSTLAPEGAQHHEVAACVLKA